MALQVADVSDFQDEVIRQLLLDAEVIRHHAGRPQIHGREPCEGNRRGWSNSSTGRVVDVAHRQARDVLKRRIRGAALLADRVRWGPIEEDTESGADSSPPLSERIVSNA